jgi:hypothetical protein
MLKKSLLLHDLLKITSITPVGSNVFELPLSNNPAGRSLGFSANQEKPIL